MVGSVGGFEVVFDVEMEHVNIKHRAEGARGLSGQKVLRQWDRVLLCLRYFERRDFSQSVLQF
jgi:hypothetical protein